MTDGPKDWRWTPDLLWQRTRLGREEYVQRLLAALVLGAPTTTAPETHPLYGFRV